MREIVFDTETTGLDPLKGDRIVEIGCIELYNTIPTGQTFHVYLDPERDMPEDAFRVHGLSREFLAGKPKFAEIAEEFLNFIGDAKLIAHNADFDMRFVNAELERCGRGRLGLDRVIDTLQLARRRHPGASNSLDALCARYGVDSSRRSRHGALLDSELLAEIYAELTGGRQAAMTLVEATVTVEETVVFEISARSEPIESLLTERELTAHAAFVERLGEKAIWLKYRT